MKISGKRNDDYILNEDDFNFDEVRIVRSSRKTAKEEVVSIRNCLEIHLDNAKSNRSITLDGLCKRSMLESKKLPEVSASSTCRNAEARQL
ncbi:hypothetical protein L5515_010563 [Caenorhabditis briggsae]|uniref:Uncharacterized protein n=1 Tax=Caenorhabditis briggsae TaxID=6238 RepID=A0AAE9JDD1_CAEBR|nr:hypothetical protein L5515_010563 [Caenorhabditis briggsae]